jgi:uncharacterized membrane protein
MEPERIEDLQKKPDEYALAGISYLSFLFGAFIFSGIMVAVTKDKSEYVRFHAAQCLAAQVLIFGGLMVYVVLFMAVAIFVAMSAAHAAKPPAALFLIFPIHFLVVFGTLGLNFFLGIWGMLKGFSGKDFAVPVVGKWVFGRFFKGKRAAR